VYPDFHPGAPLPAGLSADNLYPPGDIAAAAGCIAQLEKAEKPVSIRFTSGELARIHDPQLYLARFAELLNPERLAALPPFPDEAARVRKSFPDWATLGLYQMQMKRLRFGWRGIVRHR
jgi:hypothetical protein